MKAIIPEVIRRDLQYDQEVKQTLNINLNKYESNRTFNKYDNSQTTTNITNNNNTKGFFRFILDIIFFPFILIYKIGEYFVIKYNFKGNYNKFQEERREREHTRKILKKVYKLNNFDDEIL